MTVSRTMRWVFALAAGSLPITLLALVNGPPAGSTAAPDDVNGQFSCATAGCHTSRIQGGPINAANGSITAAFSSTTYTPGTPVTITVRVAESGRSLFGFQMSARLASNNAQAGRFSTGAGVGVICSNDAPRTPNGNCPASAPLEYIEHTSPNASGEWTVTWTPPATASGPVRFYLAGNAANGNFASDGDDHIYTTAVTLNPASACTATAPVTTSVISAGAFGARTDFSSGTWLEIYGNNFSTVTKEWAGGDFTNNGTVAPTSLDRVAVKVNGRDAFVRFISPGQVNVQAPDNPGVGPMSVTVSNCAATSAPVSLQQLSAAPGMLAPPSFIIGGRQLMVAQTTDNNFVGTIPGVASRPARPGETLVAYGIGFGNVTPSVPAGNVSNAATTLVDPVTITIGGVQLTDAQVPYKGLAPGFVGLYQLNFVVPNVPDGDQPVTIRVGSVAVPQTLFLSVRR